MRKWTRAEMAAQVAAVGERGGRRDVLRGGRVDDAAGEAFDKVARLLGLGFPGGPAVDREAQAGDPRAIAFPRAMPGSYDVSFSGLKTAVVYARKTNDNVPDLCASFQEAVVDVLTAKAVRACREAGIEHLVLGGGVAANSRLRAMAEVRASVWRRAAATARSRRL